MREKLLYVLADFLKHRKVSVTIDAILSLLDENPEVVSDARLPSGVYTQVRERDVSGRDSNASKASVTVPLGNMIDSENITYSRARLIEVLKIAQSCAKMENGFTAEDIANAELRADDLIRNLKFE